MGRREEVLYVRGYIEDRKGDVDYKIGLDHILGWGKGARTASIFD